MPALKPPDRSRKTRTDDVGAFFGEHGRALCSIIETAIGGKIDTSGMRFGAREPSFRLVLTDEDGEKRSR
jgi:hypothetical protein